MAGRSGWGWKAAPALKLAQGKETPPGLEVRLFCQGLERLLPVPGTFLVADPNGAELVSLRALRGGVGELEQPMALPHGRGVVLVGGAVLCRGRRRGPDAVPPGRRRVDVLRRQPGPDPDP